ncbi:MAG TPA: nucleotide exchange factor GrpE, partial [Gaiellales bacterium]|nr:nucleotide exchange factor GrpE [Gaiellales bacterium]
MTADPRKSAPAPETDETVGDGGAGELEAELAEARRRAEEYLNDLRRVAADFDNYRKRVARDSEAQAQRASESIVSELLPVLDNLERAVDASEHHEEAQVA